MYLFVIAFSLVFSLLAAKKSTTTTTATTLNRFKVTSCAQRSGIQTYSHEIETTTNEICIHLPKTKRLKMIMMMTMTNKCIKAQAQQTHKKALLVHPRHHGIDDKENNQQMPHQSITLSFCCILLGTYMCTHYGMHGCVFVCMCTY